MRIISGQYKGRVILMPKGIRPTQNVVRKALFDILGDISELSFLELFAGSGAVGLEALSLGAGAVVFVESSSVCVNAIRQNLSTLTGKEVSFYSPIGPGSSVICKEALSAIKSFHGSGRKFDIIFFDPPYYDETAKKALQTLFEYDILAANGLIVVQHFKKDNLPDALGVLSLFRQSRYGSTMLSFYQKAIN